jgi:cytochrome P450
MLASMSAVAPAAARRIDDLPGPPGLPLVGNALQIKAGGLHETAERWRRQYGELFRFRIGGRQFLAVSSPEVIAAVLRDRPDGFQRPARLNVTAREMGFGGLFSANGEQWRRQRPMVMHGFDPSHIKTYFPSLVKVTRRFAGRWRRAAEAGAAIDLQPDLMRYTVDVTAGLAFGADINTVESDDEVIQRHLDKVLPALFRRVYSPLPRWVPLPGERGLGGHLKALSAAVQDFIAQARARLEREPALREHPTNLIEAMIVARDTAGSGLEDSDVAGNVLTMLLAGEDTTANTLAWMIWLLSRNPAALARAREEVRAAVGAAGLPERYEQLAALPYVEACTNETMRLKPVAPIIVAQAVRDSVVAGIEVPRGALVMCLMRPAAVDERHFRDPAAFDPSRWLADPRAAASAKRVSMPFGAGPRLCPGRYLAVMEMKMVIAMLLGSFDIESVAAPGGGEPREHLAITMSPVGLALRLQCRSS